MYDKLKPCPFCGCDVTGCSAKLGRNGLFLFIHFDGCGAESKRFGIWKNVDAPDDDDEFWQCGEVIHVVEKVYKAWNMRRCSDAEQDT
jgi:hypothetical protein